MEYPFPQQQNRDRIFAAHRGLIDLYWDNDGRFIGTGESGGFRIALWHALAFLGGDEACVRKANKIIHAAYSQGPCAFAPGAALDVLLTRADRLAPETKSLLERYITLNVPTMNSHDLTVRGLNDNHPCKAMFALVVGGEMLGMPHCVERGLFRLRRAVELYESNGFPCEYNSPTYTPVSLHPLAALVEHARNEEARALALRLERFFWRDLALHFDPRIGLPAGPMSRAYVNDEDGLLSNTACLVMHLYPDRFGVDLVQELYAPKGAGCVAAHLREYNSFYLAHAVWVSSGAYHLTPELERALFERPAGTCVRGMAETTVVETGWDAGQEKPEGAPEHHIVGPRRSLLTTYYGAAYSLGSSQYAWNNNAQANSFYATVARPRAAGAKPEPRGAAVYFARMFSDENYPFGEQPKPNRTHFGDEGDSRILQYRNSALVFYNPIPRRKLYRRLRVGMFRPLAFSAPEELYVGEQAVPSLNIVWHRPEPIAIRDGSVYIGIIPLLKDRNVQGREAILHVQTYSGHLAILMSSFEDWNPKAFSYADLLETNAGFAFEIRDAAEFASFAEFRRWLGQAQIEDQYYLRLRTTRYERPERKLLSVYSPFTTAFNHASVGRSALPVPTFRVDGIADPGNGLGEEIES